MKFELDLDLPGIIAQAVSAEKLQPIIDKAVDTALRSAIEEATGYRSEFRNTLEAQVAAALPHGLHLDDTAKLQHLMNIAFSDMVGRFNAEAVRAMFERTRAIPLPEVPTEVKLSELLESARDGLHVFDESKGFFCELKESEYSAGTHYLSLDEDEGSSEYRAAYRLSINKDGEVYSLKLDGQQVTPSFLPDVIGTFDATLMSMYVGRTKLRLDMDEYDIERAAMAPHEREA